jgi:hypothetical protein
MSKFKPYVMQDKETWSKFAETEKSQATEAIARAKVTRFEFMLTSKWPGCKDDDAQKSVAKKQLEKITGQKVDASTLTFPPLLAEVQRLLGNKAAFDKGVGQATSGPSSSSSSGAPLKKGISSAASAASAGSSRTASKK